MMKDKYKGMKYSDLRQLYAERVGYMGIENPEIPRTKKDLVTMLGAMDTMGVPQDGRTNPRESVRAALLKILRDGVAESERTGKPLPVIVS